jgi:hypothetical protein
MKSTTGGAQVLNQVQNNFGTVKWFGITTPCSSCCTFALAQLWLAQLRRGA